MGAARQTLAGDEQRDEPGIRFADTGLDQTVANLIGAASGSASERCMALPVVVPVGKEATEA